MQTVEIKKVIKTYGNRRETIHQMTEAEFVALAQKYANDSWTVIKNPAADGSTNLVLCFCSPDYEEAKQAPWEYYWQLDLYLVPIDWAAQVA